VYSGREEEEEEEEDGEDLRSTHSKPSKRTVLFTSTIEFE
jgi:hypothetical protein